MHTLEVKSRPSGKANALRRDGFVPGVVYGPAIESVAIAIARRDLLSLFSKITRSSRINLSLTEEGKTRDFDAFLKAVDYDAITDEPLHVDFYHPETEHPLRLDVPVRIVGEAPGTKAGGVLNVQFNTIPVHGLPKDIPALFTIDVSELGLGDAVHVREMDFGDVEVMLPPERTIVQVIAPRGMGLGPAEEEEGLEGEEPTAEMEGEGATEGVAGEDGAEAGTENV